MIRHNRLQAKAVALDIPSSYQEPRHEPACVMIADKKQARLLDF